MSPPIPDSGEGYNIVEAAWAEPVGDGGKGSPTCIGTATSRKTHVELHIITVQSGELAESLAPSRFGASIGRTLARWATAS